MQNDNSLKTHFWSGSIPRQIFQDGRTIIHQRCLRCGRDFGRELGESAWPAVHVGLLRVELLAEKVNERWLSEACPKQILWVDCLHREIRGDL
jgi:hypothetical protein